MTSEHAPEQMRLSAVEVVERTELRRVERGAMLDSKVRTQLGQFFTPAAAAAWIAAQVELPPDGTFRVLDPGAGVGSLTAALVARAAEERRDLKLALSVFELDPALRHDLERTLEECAEAHPCSTEYFGEDFLRWAVDYLRPAIFDSATSAFAGWDVIIMNPPYRKIRADSPERLLLQRAGIETTNLYSAFVLLALRLLQPGGQLVAITPRSFANGTYFRRFREALLAAGALTHLHVFDSRNAVFADSAVLQENVIFRLVRGARASDVTISTSRGFSDEPVVRVVPHDQVVSPSDRQSFIRVTTDVSALELAARMDRMPCSLADLGVNVSTGRVVDFRTQQNLRKNLEEGTAPLLYPGHLQNGRVKWPMARGKKPNALAVNGSTQRLLFPSGAYALVKRFSAKEEPRRVSAALLLDEDLPGRLVAVENHLNVLHAAGRPLDRSLAAGLVAFLNSTYVDRFVRIFSGHTQINAGDLKSLRYPTRDELRWLGNELVNELAGPHIDALVQHLLTSVAQECSEEARR